MCVHILRPEDISILKAYTRVVRVPLEKRISRIEQLYENDGQINVSTVLLGRRAICIRLNYLPFIVSYIYLGKELETAVI